MKNPKALIIFLLSFFPSLLFAQSLSGIWSGTLVNDSMKRKQNFELGLSDYKGKITGYTYTTFIENDTFYYSIKRVSAERRDGMLVVQDEEMIGNNFPERRSKKVKQTTIFPLLNDSTIDIAHGTWSTNKTKQFYSIGGRAELKIQPDEEQSDLAAHLKEMKVKTDLAFQKPANKERSAVIVKEPAIVFENGKQLPEKMYIPPAVSNNETAVKDNISNKNIGTAKLPAPSPASKPVVEEKEVVIQEKKSDNTVASLPEPKKKDVVTVEKKIKTTTDNKPEITVKKEEPVIVKNIPEKQANISVSQSTATLPAATQKNEIKQPTVFTLPAAVAQRNIDKAEELFFKGDSIILSLYDNGIVDGDTVSVFVNGENILMKQKLKEAATRKTIYTSAYSDSLQIVLFADNLGTIPPNTGLLTIRDGDDLYQVRFSADLNKNAAIVLRRKK